MSYAEIVFATVPDAPPAYPVLWCSINNRTAPWGETIKVEV